MLHWNRENPRASELPRSAKPVGEILTDQQTEREGRATLTASVVFGAVHDPHANLLDLIAGASIPPGGIGVPHGGIPSSFFISKLFVGSIGMTRLRPLSLQFGSVEGMPLTGKFVPIAATPTSAMYVLALSFMVSPPTVPAWQNVPPLQPLSLMIS